MRLISCVRGAREGMQLSESALYARHALERVGLEKSKNRQKGGVQRIFSIKGALIKRVGLK